MTGETTGDANASAGTPTTGLEPEANEAGTLRPVRRHATPRVALGVCLHPAPVGAGVYFHFASSGTLTPGIGTVLASR